MNIRKFIAYQSGVILLAVAVFACAMLAVYTDMESRLSFGAVVYASALSAAALAIYLAARYLAERRSIRKFDAGDAWPLSLEGEHCSKKLRERELQAIREMNELRRMQYDTRDYMVSWFHEIKTPIAAMRLMQQTEWDPRKLEDELDRIEHYAEQALYYAKLESFTEDYDIRPVRLDKLAQERVKAHARMFIAKRIRIDLKTEDETVLSDLTWLRFMLDQLLTNSLKYTPQGGVITIATEATEQEKRLIVTDTGIGIPAEEVERIFQRGYTGSNGRLAGKSTGMGLYLAQRMARRLGHAIGCTSEAGGGTEMTIRFPLSDSAYIPIARRE